MKINRLIPIMLLLTITLMGCKKDGNAGDGLSKDEMNFTAGSSPNTKTVYDKNNAWQINWIKGDQITVFCEQAGNKKQATYDVTPIAATPHKGTITLALSESPDNSKERRTGLRWRTGKHNVYSVYPSLEQSGGNITKTGEGKFTFNFPQTQYCSKDDVTPVNGNYMLNPNMYLAYMVAKNEGLDPLSFVELLFKPIATTLEITVRGDAQQLGQTESLEISSLELKVKNLAGQYVKLVDTNYQVQFNAMQQYTTPTTSVSDALTPYTSGSVTTADFSIKLNGNNTFKFAANESVTFTVFLPPIEKLDDVEVKCMGAGGLELGKKKILTNVQYASSASKRRIKLPPITGWEYIIHAHMEPFSYYGGTKPFYVTSIKRKTENDYIHVAWDVEYSEDGGATWSKNRPDWLIDFTESGDGSEQYSATASATIGISNSIHTDNLKNKPQKGSQNSPYNLSNSSGGAAVQNTANCYVVDASGYYSFPLVYGNAIKNGATNSGSYTYNGPSLNSNRLTTFLNHAGDITAPYIKDNGYVPHFAELIWQDAPSLITELNYNPSGKGAITFKVDKSTIKQGNAVIAIKDSDSTVLWSWHIWVTDADVNNSIAVTNRDNVISDFMPINLGCVDVETITYPEVSCMVKFTMAEGGKSAVMTVKKSEFSQLTPEYNCLYQWGRKDPFPSNGKHWYDINNNRLTYHNAANPISYAVSTYQIQKPYPSVSDMIMREIKNPFVFTIGGATMYALVNRWHADSPGLPVISDINKAITKTVYDPSPIGYCLPAPDVFTGFVSPYINPKTGDTTQYSGYTGYNNINGYYERVSLGEQGWHLYTNSTNNETIYFPHVDGRYQNSGNIGILYIGTLYWTAVKGSGSFGNGHCLQVDMGSGVNVMYSYTTTNGANVRPCKEK